jgi:CheY-like chemotaxis protein
LAEDNPVNALVTRELLRRRGHEVHEVVSGEAAIEAMAKTQYDLLLTDIHMPGLGGIEATQRIREEEAEHGKARTPIIALTADALETGRQACQDAGMDGFLTKPIDPAELTAMITALFPEKTRLREAAA